VVAEQGPAIADRTPILSLFSAEAVSQIGNTMTIVAGPWFVLQTTGSTAKTGLVSAALVLGSGFCRRWSENPLSTGWGSSALRRHGLRSPRRR
jgi:hypothetical protein